MDETEQARQTVAAEFAAAGRHDFKDYIDGKLAGDFAAALARILSGKSEGPARQALDIAQRAINDLRRYTYDTSPQRRTKRAEHYQECLDALSNVLGIRPSHEWPRETWISDGSDAALAELERDAASLLSRIDISYDHPMDSVVSGTVASAKNFVRKAIADAYEQRRAVALMERELRMEEQESDHWARKATLDGDLGANPPVFLADVVEDLKKELEEVKAERDEHACVREKLRRDYLDVYDRLLQAEARL